MARIADARAREQLQVVAGKVTAMAMVEGGVEVRVKPRGSRCFTEIRGARLIDCTGLNGDPTKLDQPLLKQMLDDGLIRSDPLRLGLHVDADGALIDRGGSAAADLFALGPITKGAFWEIIAVPDLRVACEAMAERLLPDAVKAPRYSARL
jgi:uncharacterized NAD(P)/FAD-binding protein YdhS